MSRFTNPVPEYTNNSGTLLANGLLYFYESGTNTTKITYADVNETVANPQPLVLNGDGTVPNCFFSGSAKVVLADEDDVQQWERDPVTSTEVSSFGEAWDSVSIYNLNEVITYNGILYVSIIAANQNNNPASVLTAWTQFDLLKRWNVNETYQVRDPVIGTDYTIYLSQVANNLGNDPTVPSANWAASGAGSGATFSFTAWDASTDYAVGGANIVTGTDGKYYVSIRTPNISQDPTTPSPTYWSMLALPTIYNSNESFSVGDNTIGSDGVLYTNLIASTGVDPVGDSTGTWSGASTIHVSTVTTSDPAWTPRGATKSIEFTVIGGGGGGGGVGVGAGQGQSGGGGGGGTAIKTTNIVEASYSLVVGAGGLGGAAGANNGAGGAASSITSTNVNISGVGGGGGGGMASVTVTSATGVASGGGAGGAPDYGSGGGEGGIGLVNVGVAVSYASSGGSSLGGQIANRNGIAGFSATISGAGGGGCTGSVDLAGGDGADGLIIIKEYF